MQNETIRQLVSKYLNEYGQRMVEVHLQDGHPELAQCYLLGAADSLWGKGEISDEEALQVYELLELSAIYKATLREYRERRSRTMLQQ